MIQIYKNICIPQNYLTEEILLGIIIIYPYIIYNTKNILRKEYFFLEFNEVIYLNLLENKKKENNIIYLFYKLESSKILEKIGGVKRIISMMRQSQIFINLYNINNYIEDLIRSLNSQYVRRLIIQYGYNIIKLGYLLLPNNEYIYKKILFYIKFLEAELNKYDNTDKITKNIKELISIKLLKVKYPSIYNILNNKQNIKIIKSGFRELDLISNGLPEGNLIIIAGRPSVGKTSFAINIAYNVLFYQKISICLFSLEMSCKEILNKILSRSCNININNNQNIKIDIKNWKKLINICKNLLKNNIFINDKYNIGVNYIAYISTKLKKNNNIGLIIIDYLQLIEFSSKNNKKFNRSQELGYITRKLKLLAQSLKLPIIVLSQLNRNIEIRHDKDPLLSDLKESGCIYYQCNTNILYSINDLSIKNINFRQNQYNYLQINSIWSKKTKGKNKKNNYPRIIHFSQKILFRLICKKLEIIITDCHRYLSQKLWLNNYLSIQSTKINLVHKNRLKKYKIIQKCNTKRIKYFLNSLTYDINFSYKFNFVLKQVILHNSIEQDSDIIMMLHNRKDSTKNRNKKTIEIKICKNRNGRTGSCKVTFIPETILFNSETENIINEEF
uniref:DNA 5'-3' helicase n=1 Tax=Chondria tumulosa TaxID=2740715 RepID=A0A896SUH4_9FLOR|nr:replication helicase subunit [Chondria tumulosa]QSD57184.1 replication helicase subunit [Chondria tumulosa]